MARRHAHVFCIETPWSSDLTDRRSVRPLLEVVEANSSVSFIHRDAATTEEFEHYVQKWPQKRYASYTIGYFAFHGAPDGLTVGRRHLGLERMQELLADRLVGKTVYLSSCSTLAIDEELIEEFLDVTRARAVCGFSKDIDWMDAAAFDLAFIDAVSSYTRPSDAFRYLERMHAGTVDRLGFTAAWKRRRR